MNRHILIILLISLFTIPTSWGFHDRGVGYCSGCHITHISFDDISYTPNSPNGNDFLLKAETPSDLCLSCHATQFGEVFGTNPLAPPSEKGAGNFVFLLEDNINDADTLSGVINGNASGHNLNAPSVGVSSDPQYTTSPGGTFPSSLLGCTSCHDPHGNDNFRMLYSAGPVQNNSFTFIYDAPIAEGIDIIPITAAESKTNHTAYMSGMSDWCANCHGLDYHENENNSSAFEHDGIGNLRTGIVNRYNRYNGTDDPMGEIATTSYLPEVPFEDINNTVNSTQGPTQDSKIFCLTCHRAHGSSSPKAGRWDFKVQYLQDDGVASGSYPIPNPYTNTQQEQLCHKCHSFQLNPTITPSE